MKTDQSDTSGDFQVVDPKDVLIEPPERPDDYTDYDDTGIDPDERLARR